MDDGRQSGELGTYELRVRGRLGDLFLSALPHAIAVRLPGHTCLITEPLDDRDLVEVVRMMVSTGLEVESIREASSGPPGAARLG